MNIAESCGRISNPDFKRFLYNSIGSANEITYQLLLLKDLEILSARDYESLNEDIIIIRKEIFNLAKSLTRN